ncbi:rhomboid family intramembrane serine protease [Flavobacterium cyanobacteriorum]|uniref:Rhomboid family intramembrane serine protease n=1 Tax=Flavobacterium cyanobacteriorum TaxID=2022802 RepID=A0A255Z8I5_9FLAO|nr:rhomboid family intramembrane serine protease [Flavobacterium cyanobacteriorum]OYQ37742.1 rhomboid family intramembrane serine protease [Flavobacterium cyanobacteriorum]
MIDSRDKHFTFTPSVILWPLMATLLIWGVFWVEVKYEDLTHYGIFPRTPGGLRGVLFSPFLHGSLEHLYNNSIPLFLLIAAMRFFYRRQALQIIIYGIVLSGLFTWAIGRPSYHIGASSLIYVLVSFIFFKGLQTGYYRLVALSLLIATFYGGMIWYVFPGVEDNISWEGHLAGFFTGLLFSVIYKTPEYRKPITYAWEHPDFDPGTDPFMKRFDENGNFVNPPKPPDIEVTDAEVLSPPPQIRIVYNYRADKQEGENNRNNP